MRVLDDAEAVAAAAADELVRRAAEAFAREQRFSVALSGGSTPKRLYRLLAAPPHRERVRWDRVHFFWGDERSVPPDHPDSNFRAAHEALLSKLELPAGNVHRIPAERGRAAAVAYEEELRAFFEASAGEWPRFDLVLLGMGTDGHTASLFPQTPALRERQRLVVAQRVEKLGADRVTLTYPVLNKAAAVVFLVTGAEKAQTLKRVLEGAPRPEQLPAQAVRPRRGALLWLVDRSAGKLLDQD